MQTVMDFMNDGQLNLFPASEPEYCLYCDVVEIAAGDVYCLNCTDAVCRDLHELYARE